MHFQRFSTVFTLAITLLTAGCATQVAVLKGFQPQEDKVNLKVVDIRPEKEKTTEMLSFSITNCDYGIRRLGDEVTVPSRLVLLQRDLIRNLGATAQGKEVSISHYTIHLNSGAEFRKGVYGSNQGLVANVMSRMGSSCPREETTAGWYSAADVTSPNSPLIVEITAAVNGKQHAVRTVYSPTSRFDFSDPEGSQLIFEAMRKAADILSESIKADANRT